MNKIAQIITATALTIAASVLSSCSTVNPKSSSSGSAFSFDPPVTQPTNRSAVRVAISTSAQKMYILEGDKVLLASPVAVGKSATPTPQGTHRITAKTKFRRRQSEPGRGYPMTYWMSFYSPAYGMHWGFVKPFPCTAGCVRMPLNTARKAFDILSVGTKVNVATSQPWDATVGKSLPRLDDSSLPNPPASYMKSQKVFQDAEKGKMWNF